MGEENPDLVSAGRLLASVKDHRNVRGYGRRFGHCGLVT
jgi:hypothetical protein